MPTLQHWPQKPGNLLLLHTVGQPVKIKASNPAATFQFNVSPQEQGMKFNAQENQVKQTPGQGQGLATGNWSSAHSEASGSPPATWSSA